MMDDDELRVEAAYLAAQHKARQESRHRLLLWANIVAAVASVVEFARDRGWSVKGVASSGLPGPAGNRETFVWVVP